MYFNETLPDLLQDCDHGVEAITTPLFMDHHFTLEWHEEYSEYYDDMYHQYLQGYIAFTREGFELAETFLSRIDSVIRNPHVDISRLFDRDFHAWVAPGNPPTIYQCEGPASSNSDLCLWRRFHCHPLFNMAYQFRCLVNSSIHRTGEQRYPEYFLRIHRHFIWTAIRSYRYLRLDAWFSIRPDPLRPASRRWEIDLILSHSYNDIRECIIGSNIRSTGIL